MIKVDSEKCIIIPTSYQHTYAPTHTREEVPPSADPATTAAAAAAAAEPTAEDYLSNFDEGNDSDDLDGHMDPRCVEEENELFCDPSD